MNTSGIIMIVLLWIFVIVMMFSDLNKDIFDKKNKDKK